MMTDEEQMEFEELGRHTFMNRCSLVRNGNVPACGSKGNHHARCIRLPKHKGYCEGPGFDEWGPRYEAWKRKDFEPGEPLPLHRRLS